MRIQEMRSGFLHLKKKMGDGTHENILEPSSITAIGTAEQEPQPGPASELASPIWAVVTFDRIEGSRLTYAKAVAKMAELDSRSVPGLCIVTDEAAARTST